MLRKTAGLLFVLILSMLVFVAPAVAQISPPPSIPSYHVFHGEVKIDGNPAPDGTMVSAHIGSLSWSTVTSDGAYGNRELFFVPSDDTAVPGKDGGANGDEIIFKVDGEEAATYTFQSTTATNLNLNVVTTGGSYYTLTVNVLPSGIGSVTLSPSIAGNNYEEGASITLTAQPASGYLFDHWSGDLSGDSNPDTITMDDDKSVVAHFIETSGQQFSLEISSEKGGSVLTPGEGTFYYQAAEKVILVASSSNGYEFDRWTGDVETVDDTRDDSTFIIMSGNKSITANFDEMGETSNEQYSLEISSTEGGSVTTPGEGTFHYDAGDVVELVASPDDGYEFNEWTGDTDAVADIDDPTTTVEMDGDTSVSATFTAVVPGISPARFIFSNLLIAPGEVSSGQQVEISIEAANNGGTTGERTVVLYINGIVEDSRTVRIAPGLAQDISFLLNKTESGVYNVAVEGLTGKFTVKAASILNTAGGFTTGIGIGIVAFIAVLALAFLIIKKKRV